MNAYFLHFDPANYTCPEEALAKLESLAADDTDVEQCGNDETYFVFSDHSFDAFVEHVQTFTEPLDLSVTIIDVTESSATGQGYIILGDFV